MPRPKCCGTVEELPVCNKFLPKVESREANVVLHVEEMEALRLKDLLKLEQIDCAESMGLSRTTFQRILQSAREKVASALLNGRVLIIEGGNFIVKNRVFECLDCGEVWEVEPCSVGGKHGYEISCPKCNSPRKVKIVDGVKHSCGGHGHQGGCCGDH